MPQPFDIVLLNFPFTDLSGGKRRPVLVLAAANAQGDFLAAQSTSQCHFTPQLSLTADDLASGTLPEPSVVRPDKVFTLNQSLIVRRVGVLTAEAFARAPSAVCAHLGRQMAQ